jgi:hypothetical protein
MKIWQAFSIAGISAALAGCSGTGTLEPNALTSMQQEAMNAAGNQQTAALPSASNPRLTITPAVGAPDTAMAPLNTRLASRARELGIPLAESPSTDGLTMKGYFSAFTEGAETTVIYVWDVIDAGGNRLTRIQGQERAPRGTAEGWAGVEPAVMDRIADQTIDAYASWLLVRAG